MNGLLSGELSSQSPLTHESAELRSWTALTVQSLIVVWYNDVFISHFRRYLVDEHAD